MPYRISPVYMNKALVRYKCVKFCIKILILLALSRGVQLVRQVSLAFAKTQLRGHGHQKTSWRGRRLQHLVRFNLFCWSLVLWIVHMDPRPWVP